MEMARLVGTRMRQLQPRNQNGDGSPLMFEELAVLRIAFAIAAKSALAMRPPFWTVRQCVFLLIRSFPKTMSRHHTTCLVPFEYATESRAVLAVDRSYNRPIFFRPVPRPLRFVACTQSHMSGGHMKEKHFSFTNNIVSTC